MDKVQSFRIHGGIRGDVQLVHLLLNGGNENIAVGTFLDLGLQGAGGIEVKDDGGARMGIHVLFAQGGQSLRHGGGGKDDDLGRILGGFFLAAAGEQAQQMSKFGVILSGKVHILHLFPEGNYSLMSALGPGEILGADLICTKSRRSPYHALAAGEARVLFFPAELLTAPGHIRDPWRQQSTFSISFSREELAAYLCVNRSALSHELSRMQQEGLITFHKNIFTLHNFS